MASILSMRGVVKRFPGVVANDGVDLDLEAGEVHALLGENGAGKSTLMKILAGLYRPDAGKIVWKGEVREFRTPLDAIESGIGMVHQHFTLIQSLTVAENVMLGRSWPGQLFFDQEAASKIVRETARSLGVDVDPLAKVSDLPAGSQQWVEIVRVLSRGADLLILDEPTSALTPHEADRLFEGIRRLAGSGTTVCFITHKLKEIAVSDQTTVLRDGRVVDTLPTAQTSERALARMMVGREIVPAPRGRLREPGAPVLQVQNVEALADGTEERVLCEVSLDLRAGEVLGVAAIAGNGQDKLAEVLVGVRPACRGCILLKGRDVTHCSARDLCCEGVAYIPDTPWRSAVLPELDLAENLILKSHFQEPIARRGVLQMEAVKRFSKSLIHDFDIRAPESAASVQKLSGGNLQRLVLARELSRDPSVIIAVNPTAGLDIGASVAVRDRLIAEREKGKAILLISADLDEILDLSDRIAVMHGGRIVSTVERAQADIEEIGLMMAGGGVGRSALGSDGRASWSAPRIVK